MIYATRAERRFANEENEGYTPDFQINRAIIDEYCGPDTIVMHPLLRDSRPGANDLSVDLNHDPRLAIFRQTDNGIPIRMAIFAVLLGVEGLVQHSMRDVTWQHPPSVPTTRPSTAWTDPRRSDFTGGRACGRPGREA